MSSMDKMTLWKMRMWNRPRPAPKPAEPKPKEKR